MRSATSNAPDITSLHGALLAGRYRIEASLGKGGSAHLYRVLDVARGQRLALKLMPHAAHDKLRELFELEYQTLASLHHPRTVQVYELGADPLGDFYTMELLEGEDLSGCAPVPFRAACDYLRDASEALGLLHARKLIHRDVSPRNLWRCRDGRVKLIDFGALAAFGRTSHVIGTPPFVPPEALELRGLDQRADLYALGAVAYYLLTGRHAYPARSMHELRELWERPLAPPSACVAQLARAELEPVPAELDALVLALLAPNEQARPADTVEVIDRLDALRGEARGHELELAEARLRNAAFVGRTRERRRCARMLQLAQRGRGQACTIESEPGMGRSRMLAELGLSARMARATVLQVTASPDGALYGSASELCLALLDALPEQALAAAAPHAELLAHLSVRVRKRLGVSAAEVPELPGELRSRVSVAFSAFFTQLAREQLLCVLLDGLEHVDDGSAACLLALARERRRARLLLFWSLVREPGRQPGLPVRTLAHVAHRVQLGALRDRELQELLASVFGAAEHLQRLGSRLFRATRGNPGHALELCSELIQSGQIGCVNGSWVLPRELDEALLGRTREQVLSGLVARLSGPARELSRVLAVHAGALSPGLCRVLAASSGQHLLPYLGELIAQGVLVPDSASLQFAHESLRRACAAELASEPRRRARGALAQQLLAAADCGVLERAQAGAHLMAAAEPRGLALALAASRELMTSEIDKLAAAAPALEEVLRLGEARGLSAYQRSSLLAALLMAGYLGDRRYVDRFGDQALQALQALCGLPLARRLAPLTGGKLALGAALATAAVRFKRDGASAAIPGFMGLVQLLLSSAATLAGAKSICFDPEAAEAYARVLEPFAELGLRHAAGFMAEYAAVIAATTRERLSETVGRLQRLIRLLDDPRLYRDHMSGPLRSLARGGAVFALASLEAHRDALEALRLAEQLEHSGLALDRVYADQIRAICHGYRGDMVLHKRYLEHAELHAIARGTTWQIETWSPGPMSSLALRMHDALMAKQASEQMCRLSESMPSLEPHARHMRGAYLLLRGRQAQALPWLEGVLHEAPGSRTAWTHSHGVLARAYNQLGEHARAHAACLRAIEHAAPADFDFIELNLSVQAEQAVANAGLGRHAEADRQLRELHARHARRLTPLTTGLLHEAQLEVALLAGDLPGARAQLEHMERAYRPTNVASLVQYCQRQAARLAKLDTAGEASDGSRSGWPGDSSPASAADWSSELRASASSSPSEQARQALQILARTVQAEHGVLYLVQAQGTPLLAATLGASAPSAALELWVRQRLLRELDGDELTQRVDEPLEKRPHAVLQDDGLCYRSYLLSVRDPIAPVVGVAALGREQTAPAACPGDVLRGLSQHLRDALSMPDEDGSIPPRSMH